MKDFDLSVYEITGNGAFTEPNEETVGYRIRELLAFCKEKGIAADQLSPAELRRFEVPLA